MKEEYKREYYKRISGTAYVKAKDKKEAKKLFEIGCFNEEDDDADYEWEMEIIKIKR